MRSIRWDPRSRLLILGSLNAVDTSALSPAALTSFLSQEASVISNTYASIPLFICIVALIVWLKRNELQPSTRPERFNPLAALDLLKQPRFALGTVCIFLYVGAEVTIGSLITDYLMLPTTLALPAEAAGKHVAFYWGGALVGRFFGSALMRTFAPGKLLAFAATAVIVLLTISATTQGVVGKVPITEESTMPGTLHPSSRRCSADQVSRAHWPEEAKSPF